MKTFTTTLILLALVSSSVFAQSKKELRAEVDALNNKLKVLQQTQADLSVAERRVSSLENQIDQLQATNDELMANMNKFLTASTQQSNTIGKTLEALKQKEAQIKDIRGIFSANDSIAFLVLTDLKKTLGENAQIGVEKGAIAIKMEEAFLYGANPKNIVIEAAAKDFVKRISVVANKYAELSVSVIGAAGDDWTVSASRISAVADALQNEFSVDPARLKSIAFARQGSSINVLLHPNFNDFYLDIRNDLKNGN